MCMYDMFTVTLYSHREDHSTQLEDTLEEQLNDSREYVFHPYPYRTRVLMSSSSREREREIRIVDLVIRMQSMS